MAADSKAKFLQDAEKYVLHGKIQQAIGEYLKIIKFEPNDVLILNTVGDLYLRQGKSSEANKYFSRVAENYVQNNFFLKAIAVYKKILNADPNNLDINSTVASLYAKQGLSVDARNQYLRVAAMLEKEGKSKESMEAYEKIVDLDPANSEIQRKLAELYLAEGARDQSHAHWIGAARAQAKAGDIIGAADSFSSALNIDALDLDAMRGYLDCCLKLNNPVPALDQLKRSVESAPDNLDLREMLGKAYLANDDPQTAAKVFQVVLSMDEGRCDNFFAVAKAWADKKEWDQAVTAIDGIIPTLISRRETDRAVQLYEQVLQSSPAHVLSLEKLASIYSATGDQGRQVEALDKIASNYLYEKKPAEAIEYLEKILRINPESDKHRNLHQQAFTEAYPGTPYVAPVEAHESIDVDGRTAIENMQTGQPDQGGPSQLVEVDLLINYGLKEKAQNLLLNLEARDPYDKEVRLRLLNLYKADKKFTEAAEQCLLLAVLHRRSKNEEAARTCLFEAKQLAPEMAQYEKDLGSFARRNGIEVEVPGDSTPAAAVESAPESEVDLSSDLLDIFFSGDEEQPAGESQELQVTEDSINETFAQSIAPQAPPKSIPEQLQEVDFYIRLGFKVEALAKLNELAKISPDNPELASRYEKLGQMNASKADGLAVEHVEEPLLNETLEITPPANEGPFEELNDALDRFVENAPDETEQPVVEARPIAGALEQLPRAPGPEKSLRDEFHANEMFADLMEEALSDDEIARESFEDHFSLGTAYRDMELNEEAIKEFEIALKIADSRKEGPRIVQCCGMLSTCFLKKGMPSSAVRWCQTGLKVSDISSHEAMALRYDMAIAHSMAGSRVRALECFDQIFGLDPGYRDVAQRIDELKGGFERNAP